MTARVQALAAAETWRDRLGHAVERIEIAGSLRRGLVEVKDVELVAVPRIGVDLFGGRDDGACQLALAIEHEVLVEHRLRWRHETHPSGPPSWKVGRRAWHLVDTTTKIRIDLFAVRPPAQWGAIFAIRTGPAEYSQELVTRCRDRGLRCEEGRLVDAHGQTVPTPTERDFIVACGLPYREPHERGLR